MVQQHFFFGGYRENRRISPPAQDGAEDSDRLLLTENPACTFSYPRCQVRGISFERFPRPWQTYRNHPSHSFSHNYAYWNISFPTSTSYGNYVFAYSSTTLFWLISLRDPRRLNSFSGTSSSFIASRLFWLSPLLILALRSCSGLRKEWRA